MTSLTAKKIVVRTICNPFFSSVISRAYRGAIPHRGFVIDTNNRYVSRRIAASLFWGLYEKAEINFVLQFLRSDLDVVELGSSLGVVSLHVSQMRGPERKHVCVEANPHLIQTIRKNLARNSRSNITEVLHRAIDYTKPLDTEFAVSEDNLASHLGNKKTQKTVRVKTITLSQILDDYKIGSFALVSDIEGAEVGLILSDDAALKRCQQIIIELHETEHDGMRYTVEDLRMKIEEIHGFKVMASRGDVFVFQKSEVSEK